MLMKPPPGTRATVGGVAVGPEGISVPPHEVKSYEKAGWKPVRTRVARPPRKEKPAKDES